MLDSPKETAVVAEQARRRALSEHTLMHRLTILLHEVLVAQPVERAPAPPEPLPRSPYTLHR